MRIRSIKPEFVLDEQVSRWPAETRLAYIYLWMEADDHGRLRANATYLRSQLFPYDDRINLEKVLAPIVKSGKLFLYNAKGESYGYLVNFHKHQRINRPSKPVHPEPPEAELRKHCESHGILSEHAVRARGGLTEGSRLSRARADQGAGNRERNREQGGDGSRTDEVNQEPSDFRKKAEMFRDLHEACEGVDDVVIMELVRSYPGADWDEAARAFRIDYAGVQAFRTSPQAAFRAYLSKSEMHRMGGGQKKEGAPAASQVFKGLA